MAKNHARIRGMELGHSPRPSFVEGSKKSKSRRKIGIKKRTKRRIKMKSRIARTAAVRAHLDHALSPAPHPLPDPSLHLSLSSLLKHLNRRVSFRFPLGTGQCHEHVFQC